MQNHRVIISVDEILRWREIHQDIPDIERSRLPLCHVRKSLKKQRIPEREISISQRDRVEIFHRHVLLEYINTAEDRSSEGHLVEEDKRQDNQPT